MQRVLLEFLESHWREPDDGHLGDPRAAPPIHAFEGDGLGRRSTGRCKEVERVRPRRARSTTGGTCASDIHDEVLRRAASTPAATRFVQSYGSRRARRQPAPDARGRVPAADGQAGGRNGGGDRARAVPRRLRPAVTMTKRPRRRRPAAGGGGVPALHVLAGRRLPARRAPRGGARAVRAAAGAAQRRGAAVGGVRPSRRSGCVGNFPQALSHLALVNTALDLAAGSGPTGVPVAPGVPAKVSSARRPKML